MGWAVCSQGMQVVAEHSGCTHLGWCGQQLSAQLHVQPNRIVQLKEPSGRPGPIQCIQGLSNLDYRLQEEQDFGTDIKVLQEKIQLDDYSPHVSARLFLFGQTVLDDTSWIFLQGSKQDSKYIVGSLY